MSKLPVTEGFIIVLDNRRFLRREKDGTLTWSLHPRRCLVFKHRFNAVNILQRFTGEKGLMRFSPSKPVIKYFKLM